MRTNAIPLAMNETPLLLIIDDDPDDIELFQEAVKEVGSYINCISAKDGRDAIDLLNQDGIKLPSAIFLDLNMPRLNGKQCLSEIKKIKKLSHIPVIIYSTTRQRQDEEDLKRMGAMEFLIKPPSFPEICSAVKSILQEVLPANE